MIDPITHKQIVDTPYYECNDRISNSALGWFINQGPAYFHKKLSGLVEEEPTRAMERGTAIHMRLLQPEEFQKTYLVWTGAKPSSDKQEAFCQKLINSVEIEPDKALLSAYKDCYSTTGQTDEKMLLKAKEIANTLKDYISYLRNPERTLLSMYDYRKIERLEENANKHKLAKLLLNPKHGELHHEFHINWERYGIPCKSLLDSVHFDFENKVCTLMDLKTTVKINHFEDSVNQYDYTRQLTFYTMALIWYLDTERNEDPSKWKFKWYIIALDTTDSDRVRVFEFTDDQILDNMDRIDMALTDIKWHTEKNLWEHSREYYQGNGAETLTL